MPCGRLTVARSCWSAYLGSMFSRAWNSIVSENLSDAVLSAAFTASSGSSCSVLGGTLLSIALHRGRQLGAELTG